MKGVVTVYLDDPNPVAPVDAVQLKIIHQKLNNPVLWIAGDLLRRDCSLFYRHAKARSFFVIPKEILKEALEESRDYIKFLIGKAIPLEELFAQRADIELLATQSNKPMNVLSAPAKSALAPGSDKKAERNRKRREANFRATEKYLSNRGAAVGCLDADGDVIPARIWSELKKLSESEKVIPGLDGEKLLGRTRYIDYIKTRKGSLQRSSFKFK